MRLAAPTQLAKNVKPGKQSKPVARERVLTWPRGLCAAQKPPLRILEILLILGADFISEAVGASILYSVRIIVHGRSADAASSDVGGKRRCVAQ
eukprot:5021613-Amphidinium_carterae.1